MLFLPATSKCLHSAAPEVSEADDAGSVPGRHGRREHIPQARRWKTVQVLCNSRPPRRRYSLFVPRIRHTGPSHPPTVRTCAADQGPDHSCLSASSYVEADSLPCIHQKAQSDAQFLGVARISDVHREILRVRMERRRVGGKSAGGSGKVLEEGWRRLDRGWGIARLQATTQEHGRVYGGRPICSTRKP